MWSWITFECQSLWIHSDSIGSVLSAQIWLRDRRTSWRDGRVRPRPPPARSWSKRWWAWWPHCWGWSPPSPAPCSGTPAGTHTQTRSEHTHRPCTASPPSPHFSAFTTDICLCMRLLIMQHKDKMYITETVMHFLVTVSHSSCKCYLGGYHGGLRSYLNQCI